MNLKPMRGNVHILVEKTRKMGSLYLPISSKLAEMSSGLILASCGEPYLVGTFVYFQPAKWKLNILLEEGETYVVSVPEKCCLFYWDSLNRKSVAFSGMLVVEDLGTMKEVMSSIITVAGVTMTSPDRPCSRVKVISSGDPEIFEGEELVAECMAYSYPFTLKDGRVVNAMAASQALGKLIETETN